jgi:transposase InsO family protein
MATGGLRGRQKRRSKKTTITDAKQLTPAVDLLRRGFAPQTRALNAAWVGDITYIRTWEGWAYLATADHMRTSLIEEAMTMAIQARRPSLGLIFHSDRGSQYTSAAFRALLARHNVRQSLSRARQCWDNAVAESFFRTLKVELIYRAAWPTVAAARTAVFDTSRCSTIADGSTPPSATNLPLPMRRLSQKDDQWRLPPPKNCVRLNGVGPLLDLTTYH